MIPHHVNPDDFSVLDLRQFPVVVMHCPSKMTPEWTKQGITDLSMLIWARVKFCVVINALTTHEAPPVHCRKMIADWMTTHSDDYKGYHHGFVVVSRSTIVRFAMAAIQWLVPHEVPVAYRDTLGEGVDWARHTLYEAGVDDVRATYVL